MRRIKPNSLASNKQNQDYENTNKPEEIIDENTIVFTDRICVIISELHAG